jgi:superfamily II DNA or RNA helicase
VTRVREEEIQSATTGNAGLLPAHLPPLRRLRGLSIADLARDVAATLRLPEDEDRIAGALEQLEAGALDATALAPEAVGAIAAALGEDPHTLGASSRAFTFSEPTPRGAPDSPSFERFFKTAPGQAGSEVDRQIADPAADVGSRMPHDLIGKRIRLRGHFIGAIRLEGVEDLGGAYLLRVRTDAGSLDETTITAEELTAGALEHVDEGKQLVEGGSFFDVIESHRIAHAYAHDPNFAVSMSGVRGLPHQIVAVYRHMLPQARLRFVLADDPGAGKTIMAGLLIKELHLRSVADRVLVLCPAPLTVQWKEELHDKFDEDFTIIDSHQAKWQLGGNPWERHERCIASVDFAKREEITPDLLRAEWDLVIIDEAHKCSAVSRWDAEEQRDKLDRTQRYVLAEELSRRSERLILATATPHSGDRSRFLNFLKLLDPDQFSDEQLAAEQIGREDSPYFLRRAKEDLKDEYGNDLFVPREVLTQPFRLSAAELALYEAVTEYIQDFLGQASGRRGTAVALARTVLQRRLASSLGAIRSSLRKRADRIAAKIEEVEGLPKNEQAARLAELRLMDVLDSEQESEDTTEEEQDEAAVGVVIADTLDSMRVEIKALEQLVAQADRTIEGAEETKLTALKNCLDRAELSELKDGRGKLLIFTEHRDTLDYLVRNLETWGYSVCSIHGGHPPTTRKQIQQEFHQERQICVATEAAGEGINLQFCHLMINYDMPWNPVRLEQRMGRIHRIGQESTCIVFNFVAENTVEGKLLGRLLEKLADMREDLGGRVYDVVGEVLQRSGLDFERLLRDALLNPKRVDEGEREIAAIDPKALEAYERDIGVAQATKHVDMAWVRRRDWRSEERRLMPEFVERYFRRACDQVGVRVEERRDGLLRIEHVPRSVTSDRLRSVKRLGRPQSTYRKLTFRKEQKARAEHEDAVLLSPGHPLFASVSEAMLEKLAGFEGATAPFIAPWADEPYSIHFFVYRVQGLSLAGEREDVYAELVALTEAPDGFALVSPDVLHDLTPADFGPRELAPPDSEEVRRASDHVRVSVQQEIVKEQREERYEQAELRSQYLEESMDGQLVRLQEKWAELDERVYKGDEAVTFARDEAQRRIDELERRKTTKLAAFEQLGIVRPGPVQYVGTALLNPWPGPEEPAVEAMKNDPAVELAAMAWAMEQEREAGWEPEDVSHFRDGRGFDIRSVRRDASGREQVRRIEVKGRGPSQGDVSLCRTEWIAANRHRDSYWLYVVYNATSESRRGVKIEDPAGVLASDVKKVDRVTTYYIPGEAIERAAG